MIDVIAGIFLGLWFKSAKLINNEKFAKKALIIFLFILLGVEVITKANFSILILSLVIIYMSGK